jgi:DNA-binding NarL/FixJ family response regulator
MAAGLGNPETDAARTHALAEVALLAGDAEEAAALFERALATAEQLEIPLEAALTSWRAGVALARCGRRDAAVDRLVSAYRTTRKLGARPIAARISAELLELGERVEEGSLPDEELRAGRVGLTRRQVEIVRLVAEGLTNKEIAGKLFVSPRTVDMHVSHALDRLDCRSRTEAARKAAELGLLD